MKDGVKDLIQLRLGANSDHSFIFATWLRGLYYGNSFFRQIDKDSFFDRYTFVIQNTLFRPSTVVTVAALKEDPDTIIGYSISEDFPEFRALHWVFVKLEWRGQGIARDIIPDGVTVVTHAVDSNYQMKLKPKCKSDKYLSNYEVKLKNRKMIFNPFLL